MKQKLIVLNTSQFGSLTDSYKWCQYLREYMDVTFISFDNKTKKMDIPGVNYKYVYRFDNIFLRGVWYIVYSFFYCLLHQSKVFIVYFDFCHLFPLLLGKKRFHLDIRTLSVSDDEEVNIKFDNKLRNSIAFFDSVSYISLGVKDKLSVKTKYEYILPLGSDVLSSKNKDWSSLRLLYVGTMNHRDIPKTIEAVYMYTQQYGKSDISYDIVGDGEEFNIVENKIKEYDLSDVVKVYGRIPYDELYPLFDKCNIGISFVPIKNCYQYQPPTKSYEYILSGMYCIATETQANKDIIIPQINGMLIDDTPFALFMALVDLSQKKLRLDSNEIRNTLIAKSTWDCVIMNSLLPILDDLEQRYSPVNRK